MAQIEFVGVDGCPCGWFSVGMTPNGGYMMKAFLKFDELVNYYKEAKLILVDAPIGLPERGEGRRCDIEARKKLPVGRKSSVFPTPTRDTARTVEQFPNDYERAKRIEKKRANKWLNKQSFYITFGIAEVNNLMLGQAGNDVPQIREVHPEICFWALNKGQSMRVKKTKEEGIKERLSVLQMVEPRAWTIFKKASSRIPEARVKKDDILDALVAAVTARRGWQSGGLQMLPESPDKDSKGLAMEMVYWCPDGVVCC